MRIRTPLAVALLWLTGFGAAIAGGSESVAGGPGPVAWHSSLPESRTAAQQLGRMVLLDFRADWCGPCKLMEAEVYTPAMMERIGISAVPLRIDIEQQPKLARQYHVDTLPTVIFTDSSGGELLRHTGSLDAHTLHALLDALPPDVRIINAAAAKLSAQHDDASALLELGQQLRVAGLYSSSRGYLLRALPRSQPRSRETVLIALAADSLALQQTPDARRWLRTCLKEFPASPHAPQWNVTLRQLPK